MCSNLIVWSIKSSGIVTSASSLNTDMEEDPVVKLMEVGVRLQARLGAKEKEKQAIKK